MNLLLIALGLYALGKKNKGADFGPTPPPPPPDIVPGDQRGGIIYRPGGDPNAGSGGGSKPGQGGGQRKIML